LDTNGIAIEKLKNLRKRNGKGKKPKKANRKIHRIPFAKFKQAIQSVAWQNGIDVVDLLPKLRRDVLSVDTLLRKTGYNNKRKLFRCRCGYEGNVDRTASRNIATLTLERAFLKPFLPQCSRAGGEVSPRI